MVWREMLNDLQWIPMPFSHKKDINSLIKKRVYRYWACFGIQNTNRQMNSLIFFFLLKIKKKK